MKTFSPIVSAFFLFSMLAVPAPAKEVILITNGTLVPFPGKIIKNGSLLIEDGKIMEIGTHIKSPERAKVIDAKGRPVYPGMVAVMTAVGVTGYPGAGDDTNETGNSTPHMDPYDALNPEDDCIEVTRIEGVTTVMTVSGTRSVINGKSVVLNLEGTLASDMVLKRNAAQIFNMGAKQREKYPSTLPGVVSFIKDKLDQAKQYAAKKDRSKENNDKAKEEESKEASFKKDLEMEALVDVVQGKIPVVFITVDEVTIRNALKIMKEYNLKGIIHARNGILKYADILAKEKIPVIWAGTSLIPRQWEPFDLNYRTAAELVEKGILLAFEVSGSRNARNLPVPASLSVAHGLSEEEALKALTINPAKILGVDDKVGSLEKGKIANVVIWDGSPLQMRSRVHTLIINGKIIPLTSFQTRLRHKFGKIVKERMEKEKPF